MSARADRTTAFGLFADLAQTSTRVATSIDADLAFRKYSEDVIDDETVGMLAAVADIDLVRDVFSWDFRENYSQGLRDQFAPVGPNNRESINVVSSGPQLDLPLGGRTTLSIGGDYSARRYDESTNADSDSVVYELGLFRQTSGTSTFGLVANSNEIDYSDFNAPPYDIDRLSVRYERTLATGRVLASVGTNEISYADAKTDEPLFRFEWSRSLTARSRLAINAAREFTDSGTLSSPTIIDDPSNVGGVLVSTNPLEQKRVSVSYTVTTTRTNVSFAFGIADDSYIGNTTLDAETTTAEITLRRTISPRLDVGGAFQTIQREPKDADVAQADGDDTTISAWLNRSLGRRFSVAVAWSQYERRETQTFDETRYEVRFAYNPLGSGAAAMSSAGR